MARLIYLMGPSGAGKDCLLSALRNDRKHPILVAHRYITRSADAGAENHIALSESEFFQRQAQGLFALSWQAHQHHYALGVEIDLWLEKGLDVVVNGSRAHLEHAQQRYGHHLLPVCLVVSSTLLQQRLQQRRREDAAQIYQRLQRAEDYQQHLPIRCAQLENNGPLTDTLLRLQALIQEATHLHSQEAIGGQ
ncbi:ribose 1,5-bisphosphokinase [Yersinia ruckeri]|uniref:ribose 1,5-bisphosphokinase n=1 Tax=Yersinia ruckeri TaxID=29486 RepID=UPI00226445AD|nr:ribose 1,5-bisphosphokinase [Yersinia ruckeri]UZX68101.1 ribose 1,5-bisphosphokinase [Yersinia ruckeri]